MNLFENMSFLGRVKMIYSVFCSYLPFDIWTQLIIFCVECKGRKVLQTLLIFLVGNFTLSLCWETC